jgi:hypothetical protein
MAQRLIASATTDAVTAGNQVAFTLQAKDFKNNMKPAITVKGLAGVETLTWWYLVGGTWEEIDDGTGTQLAFTATYATDYFNAPGTYGFTKDATASAVEVYKNDGR